MFPIAHNVGEAVEVVRTWAPRSPRLRPRGPAQAWNPAQIPEAAAEGSDDFPHCPVGRSRQASASAARLGQL